MEDNNATTVPAIIQAHREMLALAFALSGRRDIESLLTAIADSGAKALTSPEIPAPISEAFHKEFMEVIKRTKTMAGLKD